MKKLNTLAVAVSLALAAGNASASLNDGTIDNVPSSILFAIDDTVSNKTFILDLALGGHTGLNYTSFVNGTNGTTGSLSWNLNSFTPYTANGFGANLSTARWSVLGGYKLDDTFLNFDKTGTFTPFDDPNNAQWGALSTGKNANSFALQSYTAIEPVLTNAGQIGAWLGKVNGPSGANGANVASIDPTSATESFYRANLTGLGPLTGGDGAGTQNGISSADFFWLTNNIGVDVNDFNTRQKLGTFALNANNQLTWNSSAAAVPLPGAVWLFGSALMAFLGYSRRRSEAFAA
jgi:hypothetical protein